MNKVFEHFQATTATELALYNEIKRLSIELYLLKLDKGIYPLYQPKPMTLDIMDHSYKLIDVSSIRGNIEPNGRIKIRSEVSFKENPKKFGCIEFSDDIYRDKFEAAGALSHLHQRFMRILAHALVSEVNAT